MMEVTMIIIITMKIIDDDNYDNIDDDNLDDKNIDYNNNK